MSEFPAEPERTGAGRLGAPRTKPFLPSPPRELWSEISELPVELIVFEGAIGPILLEAAARRAERLGVGGDEVLRCFGILTPDQIVEGVAEQLEIKIDPLAEDFEPRSLTAACAGVLSRRSNDRVSRITAAARGTGIRWLAEQLADDPHARSRLRIDVIDSTTWEEAPVGYSQWLRQRWFKGWAPPVSTAFSLRRINYLY